jgi:hypothetical protein
MAGDFSPFSHPPLGTRQLSAGSQGRFYHRRFYRFNRRFTRPVTWSISK